ncbi:MAG: SDR family NAD(P)-dependent oxidoreductase [Anaerolineae bacterium]|jgi:NAD(P)-dependent dehydrogenase (short-subunit alcohol dehydrogenase family)
MRIEGKTALVTGGAHRVGKAIVLALAQAGANVVVNYHSSAEAAEQTVPEAKALGVGALAVQADVSDHEQVSAMVDAARDRFGGVDILVNSASLWKKTPFPTDNLADWQTVTGILINGSFYCANAVAPMMLARGEGAMVNIVDLSAWQPWPDRAAHCVGKAALLALTRQLALELAPAVQVNAVAPGPVLQVPGSSAQDNAETASGTLKGRWGKPEDVAGAVLFLVEADYITGEVIVVDGGQRYGPFKKALF